MWSKLLALAVLSTIAIRANAQGIAIESATYGGTGCPNGTASVSISPDQQALTVLFDQFVAEAGGVTGKRIDRKSCNLSVGVRVPSGYSVSIFQVDYRGFNAIPAGGYSKLDAEYFWAGSRGPRTGRTFYGPSADNYIATDNLIASALVWTPCGASTNLRINANMMAMSNNRMEQTMATVDSVDVTSGLIYHIQFRRCN